MSFGAASFGTVPFGSVPVSGGSGYTYTLTADAGNYTLAGANASLVYNRVFPADAGAYSLTGAAATLTYTPIGGPTHTLTADAGALSLVGNAATLAFNRSLTAASGAFTLTGSAATLARGYTLAANAGSYTLTGDDAALVATRKLIAEAYAAVLAGANATLTYTPLALPTIGRPASDTSNSGWTASAGTDLFAMVDEVTPDAGDYIVTTATGSVCELALEQTAYPGTASQALKYRASSSTGNSLIVRLKNGATTIRTETQALTATDSEYSITLTSGEIAAITSGVLSVELESA